MFADRASSSSVARPSPRRVRRRVGRPRKVRPEDIDLTSEEETVCAETSVVQRLPANKLADLVRPTGGGALTLLGHLMVLESPHDLGVDDGKLLQAVFGQTGHLCVNSACNPTSLARGLSMPRSTVARRLPQLAMAAWAGARCMAASMLNSLCMHAQAKELRVVSTIRDFSYDETPLPVRVARGGKKDGDWRTTFSRSPSIAGNRARSRRCSSRNCSVVWCRRIVTRLSTLATCMLCPSRFQFLSVARRIAWCRPSSRPTFFLTLLLSANWPRQIWTFHVPTEPRQTMPPRTSSMQERTSRVVAYLV